MLRYSIAIVIVLVLLAVLAAILIVLGWFGFIIVAGIAGGIAELF